MAEPDLRKLVKDYLSEAKLMQLSTAIDNQPWVASVWFAADRDLNIYWFSATNRRHSQEVVKNNKIAAAIVLPHTPADPPRGLQLQGVAEIVSNPKDLAIATLLFTKRIFSKRQIADFMALKYKPHKFFKIKPTQFVLFDVVSYPENSRQELNLK